MNLDVAVVVIVASLLVVTGADYAQDAVDWVDPALDRLWSHAVSDTDVALSEIEAELGPLLRHFTSTTIVVRARVSICGTLLLLASCWPWSLLRPEHFTRDGWLLTPVARGYVRLLLLATESAAAWRLAVLLLGWLPGFQLECPRAASLLTLLFGSPWFRCADADVALFRRIVRKTTVTTPAVLEAFLSHLLEDDDVGEPHLSDAFPRLEPIWDLLLERCPPEHLRRVALDHSDRLPMTAFSWIFANAVLALRRRSLAPNGSADWDPVLEWLRHSSSGRNAWLSATRALFDPDRSLAATVYRGTLVRVALDHGPWTPKQLLSALLRRRFSFASDYCPFGHDDLPDRVNEALQDDHIGVHMIVQALSRQQRANLAAELLRLSTTPNHHLRYRLLDLHVLLLTRSWVVDDLYAGASADQRRALIRLARKAGTCELRYVLARTATDCADVVRLLQPLLAPVRVERQPCEAVRQVFVTLVHVPSEVGDLDCVFDMLLRAAADLFPAAGPCRRLLAVGMYALYDRLSPEQRCLRRLDQFEALDWMDDACLDSISRDKDPIHCLICLEEFCHMTQHSNADLQTPRPVVRVHCGIHVHRQCLLVLKIMQSPLSEVRCPACNLPIQNS